MSRLTHPTIVTLEAQRGFKHKRMEVEKAAKKKEPSAPHTEKEEEGGPPLCLSFLYSLPFVCPFIHFSHSHRPSLFFLFFLLLNFIFLFRLSDFSISFPFIST